jgi:hypothetical protein
MSSQREVVEEFVTTAYKRSLTLPAGAPLQCVVLWMESGSLSLYERSCAERTWAEVKGHGVQLCAFEGADLVKDSPEYEEEMAAFDPGEHVDRLIASLLRDVRNESRETDLATCREYAEEWAANLDMGDASPTVCVRVLASGGYEADIWADGEEKDRLLGCLRFHPDGNTTWSARDIGGWAYTGVAAPWDDSREPWALFIEAGDYDIYTDGEQLVKITREYATPGQAGIHNPYRRDCLVQRWDDADGQWVDVEGFDVAADPAGGYDWKDYDNKVRDVLASFGETKPRRNVDR